MLVAMAERGGSRLARGGRAALALFAVLLAAVLALAAYYMLVPTDFDGPGILGLVALAFPLHLLAVTIIAAALGGLTWRCGAALGTLAFVLVAVLAAVMALWPSITLRQRARELGVSLSLGDYVANALRLNLLGAQPQRSVVYRTAPDGTGLQLNVWRAAGIAGDALRRAVVRVHGGAWTGGRRGDFGEWNRWLNGLGYDVFDIDYRLDPPERWRDQAGDVKCALGWVVAHSAEYGIDSTHIALMGYSAGAHLAMLAAYSVGDRRLPPSCDAPAVPVRAVINLYGPVDLVIGYDDSGSLAYAQDAFAAVYRRLARRISGALSGRLAGQPYRCGHTADDHAARRQGPHRQHWPGAHSRRRPRQSGRLPRNLPVARRGSCLRSELGRFCHPDRPRQARAFPSATPLSEVRCDGMRPGRVVGFRIYRVAPRSRLFGSIPPWNGCSR